LPAKQWYCALLVSREVKIEEDIFIIPVLPRFLMKDRPFQDTICNTVLLILYVFLLNSTHVRYVARIVSRVILCKLTNSKLSTDLITDLRG